MHAALGGYQSILDLTAPGGRLYESRKAVINAAARSKYLRLTAPSGALYAFLEVRADALPDFHDQQFALELLEEKHVLITPGSVFNVPYQQSLPHHHPAGRRHAVAGVRPHRGAAGLLVRRAVTAWRPGPAEGPACVVDAGLALQVGGDSRPRTRRQLDAAHRRGAARPAARIIVPDSHRAAALRSWMGAPPAGGRRAGVVHTRDPHGMRGWRGSGAAPCSVVCRRPRSC